MNLFLKDHFRKSDYNFQWNHILNRYRNLNFMSQRASLYFVAHQTHPQKLKAVYRVILKV